MKARTRTTQIPTLTAPTTATRMTGAQQVLGHCLMELTTTEIGGLMLKLHESTAAVGTESLGEGKYRIRIIMPGQGSSGIYTAENLAESAPLFKAGTEMFIDHPTETEEWERPERSIRDYAGVFLEDATVGEDGALYTVCKVFSGVNDLIRDKWEHIGVSINAWCNEPIAETGVVPVFAGVRSVDFVTAPGAGGGIVDLLESNRNNSITKEGTVDEKLLESKFDELKGEFASLIEALGSKLDSVVTSIQESKEEKKVEEASVDVDAAIEAGKKIAESGLPEAAVARVREALKKGADVDSALEAERAYLKEAVAATATPVVDESAGVSLKESYAKIGWK
nr:MAG TPA: Prohead core protein protease [Caudoviricetes sp.]